MDYLTNKDNLKTKLTSRMWDHGHKYLPGLMKV